jgi:hypothetical protein
MIMGRIRGWSLLGAALMGTTALTIVQPAAAQVKAGVTSATDGDPLGKPPAENERVLRIGIDVQANEVVTTHGDDRAHLVFLDGTSLTVGPNARLTIDKFVYNPNSKTGDLAITASQGVLRLVGGKISKTNAITINTPSGTIGIRGGIGVFGVSSDKTTAAFLYGQIMSLTGRQGQTQNAIRPGSVMSVNFGAAAGLPSLLPPGGLNALVNSLQLASNNSGKGGSSGNADQKAQTSGFTGNNSGQGPSGGNPGGGPPNTNNNAITNAVANTNGSTDGLIKTTSTTTTSTTTTSTTTTTNTGTPKTTQTLQGFVGGLIVDTDDGRSTTRAPLAIYSKPGDLTINKDATTGKVTATIIVRGVDGTIYSPTNATINLGTGYHGNSFFQDDLTFVTGTTNGTGTLTRNGVPVGNFSNTTALFTTAATPGTPTPFVGPGSCKCDFLTFGYWQTMATDNQHGDRLGGDKAIITQAPWVAGLVATQLPNTGSASFSGIMQGQAQNYGGAVRNVQGSYGMNYSWAAGVGSFNASFDSRSYAGGVAGTGGANFAGAFVGGNRIGTLGGAFNTSPAAGGAVVGQSGTFGINGPGYAASGIFAGAKN